MGFGTVWGDLMELEPTLSVLTLLCGVILLVILTKLRGFIDEAIAGLEEDLALALGSIEKRIQEGLEKLVEEGLDLPEAPNVAQGLILSWLQGQLAPASLEIPRDDAGRWRGEGGDELVP